MVYLVLAVVNLLQQGSLSEKFKTYIYIYIFFFFFFPGNNRQRNLRVCGISVLDINKSFSYWRNTGKQTLEELSWWLRHKESACNAAGDLGLILGLGRSSGEGNGYPLQYSCRRIPWILEPGGLQSMWSQRVGHNWVTNRNISIIKTEIRPFIALISTQQKILHLELLFMGAVTQNCYYKYVDKRRNGKANL